MNPITWFGTALATLFSQHQAAVIIAGLLSWLSVASKNGSLSALLAKIPGRAHDVAIVAVPTLVAGWQAHTFGSPLATALVAGGIAGGLALLAERFAAKGVALPIASVEKTLENVESKGLDAAGFAKELVVELAANPDVQKLIADVLAKQPINISSTFNSPAPVTSPILPPDATASPVAPKSVG